MRFEEINAGAVVVRTNFDLDEVVQFFVVSSEGMHKVKYTQIKDDVEFDDWALLQLAVRLLSHDKTEECCPHLYVQHLAFPKGKRAWGRAAQELRKKISVQSGRYGVPLRSDRDRLFQKKAVVLGAMTLWYAEGAVRPWRLSGGKCSLRTLLEFAAVVVSDRFTELFDKRVWVPWLVLTPPNRFSGPNCLERESVPAIAGWTPPRATAERAPSSIGEAIFATNSEERAIVDDDDELLEDEGEGVTSAGVDPSDESSEPGVAGLNVVSLLYLGDLERTELGIGLVKEGEIYKLAVITEESFHGATTHYEGSTCRKVYFPTFHDLVDFLVTVVLGLEFSDYRIPVFPEGCQGFHDWLPSISSKPSRSQKAARESIAQSLIRAKVDVPTRKQERSSSCLPRVGTICLREDPLYGFFFSSRGGDENPSWTKDEVVKMALLVLSDGACNSRENHYWPVLRQAVELWRARFPEAGLEEELRIVDQETSSGRPEIQPEVSTVVEEGAQPLASNEAADQQTAEPGSFPQVVPTLVVQVTAAEESSQDPWELIRDPQGIIDEHLKLVRSDFDALRNKLGSQ